jgi:Ca2+/Na+ antiporter
MDILRVCSFYLIGLTCHCCYIVRDSPLGIGSVFGGMIFNLTLGVGIVTLVATQIVPLNVITLPSRLSGM